MVWDDVERFLRDPGEILEELSKEQEIKAGAAILEAERITLEGVIADLAQRGKNAIDLNLRGTTSYAELDEHLGQITGEQKGVQERLDEIQATRMEPDEPPGGTLDIARRSVRLSRFAITSTIATD